jgi:magnesium transporter
VPLRRLITGEPMRRSSVVRAHKPPVTVDPRPDREDVARLISKYNLLAVPVVDEPIASSASSPSTTSSTR